MKSPVTAPNPPLDLLAAEDLVAKHADPDQRDDCMQSMIDAANAAKTAAETAAQKYEAVMADPMQTLLAKMRAARDVSYKSIEPATRKLDAARAKAELTIKQLQTETRPRGPRDAVEAIQHNAVHQALASMDIHSKAKSVSEAIADRDDQFATAALTGSPRLTGLCRAEIAALTDRWSRVRYPAQMDRIERLKKALSAVDATGSRLLRYVGSMHDHEAIAKAEAEEKAAREARDHAA